MKPIDPTDAENRFTELKKYPWEFDQKAGYCGFAAVLMSMFEQWKLANPPGNIKTRCPIDELYDWLKPALTPPSSFEMSKNRVYLGLSSFKLCKRLDLRRRLSDDIRIDKKVPDSTLDYELGFALILGLKQHLMGPSIMRTLKSISPPPLWADCKAYSEYFGWEYGKHLKNIDKDKTLAPKERLNYKRGDLALTPEACKELLRAVYGAGIKPSDHPLYSRSGPSVNDAVVTLKKWIVENQKRGAILGLAKTDASGNLVPFPPPATDLSGKAVAVHPEWMNIVHWVYVPRMQTYPNLDLEVYTWGKIWKISDLFKNYVPVYAIKFERP